MLLVIVSGLALGGLYGMTALVYNVMYSTSKVLSFGTGQFAMVGGICTAWLVLDLHWPLWLGFIACLVSGAVFGWLSEVIAVRRIVAASDEHLWVLSTLALSTMVQEAMSLVWGTDPTPFPRVLPQEFAGAFDQKFWLPMIFAVLMAVGLEQFYRRSMIGKLFIAMSEDSFAARARGVATDRMRSLSYVLAGVLGALSGFVGGQLTFADFALGTALGLSGFIALAVGGIGSSVGALVGGAILGMLTSLTTHYFGAEYQKTIAIGLLILLLVVRPQGSVRHHPGSPSMTHARIKPVIVGLFTLLAVVLPWLTGNVYYLHVATLIGVYWVLIATLNLLVGFTGQLSVGHVGLLAIGAYAFCLLGGGQGWNPFLALLSGGAICAVIGLLLGLPSLRLPGFYFAMATLAFGLIVSELALAEQWLTNGSVGMPAPSFPAPFDTPHGFYWLVLGIAGFVTWMTANLARFMWGRAMVALRDSTVAASSVAVPIYRTKLIVFVFSGFTAGIAGGLYATSQTYITPDAFIVNLGIYFFVAIIIGGRGVIIGPFIGAAVLAAIPELVGPLAKYGTFFYGLILLIVVLVLPGGFGELIITLAAKLRRDPQSATSIEPDLPSLRAAVRGQG